MAGRSSRVRKARSKHAEASGKLRQELVYQEGYIRDYNKLLSMGPNPPTSRKLMSAGKRGRPDAWAEGFKFVSEWDYANRNRHWSSGHRSMNKWHYSTHYRPVSSYAGLLEEFRGKAINAELYGIDAAKKGIAGITPFDSSTVKSSRGMGGSRLGSSSKVKVDKVSGQFISAGQAKSNDGGKTWTFKEPGDTGYNASASRIEGVNNFANQGYLDMGALATALETATTKEQKDDIRKAYHDKQQDTYLSNFGLTSDLKYGTDAKKPGPKSAFNSADQMDLFTKGNQIDYEGFKDLSTKEQNEFRGLLADKLVSQNIATNQWQLGISEQSTSKELDKLKKQLEKKEQKAISEEKAKILAQQNIKLTPKQQEAKFASGIWDATSVINVSFGMPEAFASELTPTQKEITELKKQIDQKQTKLQTINSQLASNQNLISTADANTVFQKAYDAGRISDESRTQLLTATNKDDSKMNFIFQRKLKYDSDETKDNLTDIGRALSQLDYLKRNKNKPGNFEKTMAQINSLVPGVLIEGETVTSDTKGFLGNELTPTTTVLDKSKHSNVTAKGVREQLTKMQAAESKKLKGLEGARHQLGSNIILASHQDRDDYISLVNDPMIAKRELEELTGMDIITGSMTTSMSPKDLTKQFRTDGLAPGSDTQKTFDSQIVSDFSQQKPDGSGRHYSPQSSWYDTWQSGNIDQSEVHKKQYDVIMRGDPEVYKTKAELQSKKGIMDKYNAWTQARKYIGGSISSWESEMTQYYRATYKDEPNPESHYIPQFNEGSSTIIPLDARSSQEKILFGERGGIRRDGDMGEVQDLAKLMTALQKENKIYEQNYIRHGEKIKAQKEKVKMLQKIHDSYGPEVNAKVSEANRLEKESKYMQVDLEFSKKLEKSSQDLFDEKNNLTKLQIQHKRYGLTKDLIKKDITEIKQERRDTQKEMLRSNMHTSTRRATPGRGRLWGYTKSKQFSRRTTANVKRTKGGSMSLGGLVL